MKQQLIEKVREFREAFGLKQSAFDPMHYRLTLEETDELVEAFINHEEFDLLKEVADALADRVFTSCGGIIDGCDMHHYLDKTIKWAELFEIDLEKAVDAVFVSNMSKLCSYEQVDDTAIKYAEIGVTVHFEPVDELDGSAGFRCVCFKTVTGTDGEEYPKGKLLKSVGYKEPCWDYLSE